MPNTQEGEQTMERRFLSLARAGVRLEKRDGSDRPHIIGLGAVIYDGTPETQYELWDGAVERIMPGAFDRAVAEDDVRGLFNHDSNIVLGRTAAGTMLIKATSAGLEYDIDPPASAAADGVIESLRRGDVSGSSFSFLVTEEVWRKEEKIEIREITGVVLYDTGPVTFPAYEATTAALKSAGAMDEARRSYDAWGKRIESEARVARRMRMRTRLAELGLT